MKDDECISTETDSSAVTLSDTHLSWFHLSPEIRIEEKFT